MTLAIKRVSVDAVQFDPSNARKHDKKNLDAIKGSLAKFGQVEPLVVQKSSGVVVGGNGRLAAMKSLGWKEVDIVEVDLDPTQATALALALNRTAELAEWDSDVLTNALKSLQAADFDIGEIGFDDDFLKIEPVEGLTDPDDVPENVDTRCKPGDLWILGEHRLLCGDSTNVQHVERLMVGEKADMVFTDPPYGVSYQSNMRKRSDRFEVIANDDVFLTEWINVLPVASAGWVFVWTTWKVVERWIEITKPIGELTNMIVWDKGGGGIGDLTRTFLTDYEIALVFNRGASITGKRLGSVWSIGKDKPSDYLHPTQKPVALCEVALANCTIGKSAVLDLFLGSGSTLIACEKTGRKCYGMEIDPKYCDVVIERWQKFTGKQAALDAGVLQDG